MNDRKSIFIIDDDADLRSLMALTLGGENFDVHQADNGRQALDALSEVRPDLIILDMMMPEMNGLEFCRHLVEGIGELDIPILVVSAVSEKAQFMREFAEMPILKQGFLRKPFQTGELVDRVREMFGETPKTAPSDKSESPDNRQPTEEAPRMETPIPARPAPVRLGSPPPPRREKLPEPHLRILTIDDDDDIRAIVKAVLESEHEVATAANGRDALAMLGQFRPQVVICDVEMPVMNGLETVEAIRKNPQFAEVPVFFLTGAREADLPRRIFEAGGNLFLRKPIDPSRLLKILRQFMAEVGIGSQAQPEMPESKSVAPTTVRVLTIDCIPRSAVLLKSLLEKNARGRWETLWSEEPQKALAALPHTEPDVIFYNPRNRSLDGIAFVQSIEIKQIKGNFQIAFVGFEYFKADFDYSRKTLGREAIRLDQHEGVVLDQLTRVIESARATARPKQFTLQELKSEDRARTDQARARRDREERERAIFRERFGRIQSFIDENK